MTMLQTIDAATLICARVDWTRPELAVPAALHQAGQVEAAALAFIRHLRTRERPLLGYTRAYAQRLRAGVTTAEREAAAQRWATAETFGLFRYEHGNTYAELGAETVIVAATPECCRRMAACVLANSTRWEEGSWGVTQSICELLRYLWPLDECTDADLLPIFAWLLTKVREEWTWARRWNENTLGSSGHNWWAHTFSGFFMLGLFFPEFTGMERFRALGIDYLDREVNILFEDDGWSKEGSPGYHDFAARNLINFAHLASMNGIIVSERTQRRLRTIADAGWRLLAPDGDYPVFADHIRFTPRHYFHGQDEPGSPACMELRRLAARFTLPEAKYVADALDADWRLTDGNLLSDEGEDVLLAYHRVPSVPPAGPDTCLPRSGFYVMRQDWTPRADYAAIIAGTLGPRVSSHKHADLFSFELYSRGRRVLVDNWYGVVDEQVENDSRRMWRVSSAAHNVATVDGQDSVPVLREFLYGASVFPLVDDWRAEADYAYFSGVHEGYFNLPERVSAYRRKLFYFRGGYWILLDRFTPETAAAHTYRLHFHLNVPATLQPDGRVVTTGEGGNLLIVPVPGMDGTPEYGPNPYPIEDYENPHHLCYTRTASGPFLFATVLVPFTGEQAPKISVTPTEVTCDERQLDVWEATALSITVNGKQDFYFDQHMQWNLPWQAGGFTGERRLFHSRCFRSG